MTRPLAARLSFLMTVVFCSIDVGILIAMPRGVFPGEFGFPGYQLVLAFGEGITGYLVATRRPRAPVGWSRSTSTRSARTS